MAVVAEGATKAGRLDTTSECGTSHAASSVRTSSTSFSPGAGTRTRSAAHTSGASTSSTLPGRCIAPSSWTATTNRCSKPPGSPSQPNRRSCTTRPAWTSRSAGRPRWAGARQAVVGADEPGSSRARRSPDDPCGQPACKRSNGVDGLTREADMRANEDELQEDMTIQAPAWIRSAVGEAENNARLDALVDVVARGASLVDHGRQAALLRGQWLGHALHPLLTDFPLGCWIGAGLLDLLGGRAARNRAQRLVDDLRSTDSPGRGRARHRERDGRVCLPALVAGAAKGSAPPGDRLGSARCRRRLGHRLSRRALVICAGR